MTQVKQVSGPGRGSSRQPKNKTLGMRNPNAVGGRTAYHYPTIKTYLKTNKKQKQLLFTQLLYILLNHRNLVLINEQQLIKHKTNQFITFISENHKQYIKKKSRQSIILFSDKNKTYDLLKNINYLICLNLKNCQEFYKINIEDLDKKLIIFTYQSLGYLLKKYKLLNQEK